MPVYTQDRRGAIIGLQLAFLLLAILTYIFRLYARLAVVKIIGNDDFLMGLAVLLSIGISITDCFGTKFGWGLHMDEIVNFSYEYVVLISWISQLLFTICTSFVKASILYFYLRLAPGGTTFRKVVWCSLAFITIWLITFACVVIFQCNPISAYWKTFKNDGSKCFAADVPLLIHGMTNSVTDLYIFLLPIPTLWHLNMPKRQRIGLMALFGIGFITVVAGAVRLYYSVITAESTDYTWMGYYLWTWEAIEINLGIICGCIPTIKPLIIRIFPSFFNSITTPRPRQYAQNPRFRTRNNNGKSSVSYAMETIASTATTKTTRGGPGLRDDNESEENLTLATAQDVNCTRTRSETDTERRGEENV